MPSADPAELASSSSPLTDGLYVYRCPMHRGSFTAQVLVTWTSAATSSVSPRFSVGSERRAREMTLFGASPLCLVIAIVCCRSEFCPVVVKASLESPPAAGAVAANASSARPATPASRTGPRRPLSCFTLSPPAESIPKHRELGLTDDEYGLIREQIDREPNDVELAMYSLLWSEHCSYKHSRKLLGRLPTEGPRVVMGPGENAGAVDVGGGYSVAFKVESHNHPSAVEPFQGAATGVGGIMRDIFALGARPIAVLDSLRFGELSSERSRYLFERVVAGIGHYGNSIGVPTVGGEVYFEPPYEQNCLVNAMCVGLARTEGLIRSAAAGPGNVLVLMGAATGRDGIGGASVLASAELGEADDDKRPTVQIGDPFEESKLVECCLELLERGLLVALQDLGAAGLTSSAAEMAEKGGVGVDIDVAKVPLREADMEPFEVMVSESQERMLAVVNPERVDDVVEVCRRWQTGASAIGTVTEDPAFRILRDGEVVGDLPISSLAEGCPLYDLEPGEPEGWMYGNAATLEASEPGQVLLELLASANVASKRWAFEQYDSIVGSRTVRRPEQADAAVLQIPEAGTSIAVAIDGNGRRVACDPHRGVIESVLECAQNLACAGAEPLGLTNCLNFGNPEKPNVAWQLTQAIEGLASVCDELEIPVVGGNVSLYNETEKGPIYPTPVVGLVGELEAPERVPGLAPAAGDEIILVGPMVPSAAGSELTKRRGELGPGLPDTSVAEVAKALALVREAVRGGDLSAAHDVSDGGIACALAEMAIAGGVGIEGDLSGLLERGCTEEEALFGEAAGGILLAASPDVILRLEERAGETGVSLTRIGRASGSALELHAGDSLLSVPVLDAEDAWRSLGGRLAA